MANNTFTLPAITVDAGFVEIREVDGELLALYINRGQETSSWYSVEKMIGVYFITMGNGSHFNLYNNFMKLWVYKADILYCIRQLLRYMGFAPDFLQRNHARWIRRFIRKYFISFAYTPHARYGYKPRYAADVIVPGPLIV